ncbi:uncharacterized protein LOC128547267 isoform X2 [Mercenaria mercenaria]|nr:uncharacterized protein LOC128547267 isoform X2 [Mercenaria mercenaria]
MGTERLKKAAKQGLKKLKIAVNRETLFLKSQPVENTLHSDFSSHKQDHVANIFLNHYHANTKAALHSTGDGDCLFNAISTCLVGDESMSVELRFRCCVEMINNRNKILRHKLYPRLVLISPDYDKDCVDCTKPGSYSSVWRMIAVSFLLNIPIDSVYPNVNGSKHIAFQSLNTSFRPPFADPEKGRITIMWTHTSVPDRNAFGENVSKRQRKEWTPNHFVPLVDVPRQSARQEESITPATNHSSASSTHSLFRSPNRFEALVTEDVHMPETDDETCSKHNELSNSYEKVDTCEPHTCEKVRETYNHYDIDEELPPSPPLEKYVLNDLSTINEEPENEKIQLSEDSVETNTSFESLKSAEMNENTTVPDNEPEEFSCGPLGNKFMDLHNTVNVFKGPYVILEEIPCGRKDGMYFVVDNTINIENRKIGKKSEIWDDCGAWKNASTPTSLFILINNKLTAIVKGQGQYCVERQVNKKREYIPLEPQPSEDSILIVHRLYQTLSASPSGKNQFKRRCTWLGSNPDFWPSAPTTVAIVEYIGTFPPRQHHGRTKDFENNIPYIRTKQVIKDELRNKLSKDSVKNVERTMNRKTNDDNEKQRNENQLKNIKAGLNRESRENYHTHNSADQIICVEEMTKTHEFVKSVKHISGIHHPVVTLYTDQQIEDIKRFCCRDGGCVLSIDKTFNLGDFHVTPTCYKDISVIRRKTNDHPICFGPTFIHTNSSTKTYSSFMHKIADNLSETEIASLVIGSDEEYAFKSAIKRCFPGCTHILCTRHLKQNMNKYMEDQVGFPQKERQQIIDEVFGTNGLVESRDIDTYNKRVENSHTKIEEYEMHSCGKQFRPYFDKVLSLINDHVIKPAENKKIPTNWTNNNSESANHILKSAIKWKAQELPKFIETLYDIVKGEQIERIRAMRNKGNYQLHSTYMHHAVDIDHWTRMTSEQQDRRVHKFLKDTGKSNPNIVISTDGRRTVLKTPSAGKKPNQVKRKRAERSRTPAKRKLVC